MKLVLTVLTLSLVGCGALENKDGSDVDQAQIEAVTEVTEATESTEGAAVTSFTKKDARTEMTATLLVNSKSEMQACDGKNQNQMIYVKGEKNLYMCQGEGWEELELGEDESTENKTTVANTNAASELNVTHVYEHLMSPSQCTDLGNAELNAWLGNNNSFCLLQMTVTRYSDNSGFIWARFKDLGSNQFYLQSASFKSGQTDAISTLDFDGSGAFAWFKFDFSGASPVMQISAGNDLTFDDSPVQDALFVAE